MLIQLIQLWDLSANMSEQGRLGEMLGQASGRVGGPHLGVEESLVVSFIFPCSKLFFFSLINTISFLENQYSGG